MRRFLPMSFVAVLTVILTGCVNRNFDAYVHGVKPGMTKTEVQSHLGPPNTVRTRNELSAWLYCDEYFLNIKDLDELVNVRDIREVRQRPRPALTVWFHEDRLADITPYVNQASVGCADFEQSFKWSDFPPRPNGYSYK